MITVKCLNRLTYYANFLLKNMFINFFHKERPGKS
jgi:hypothetical protein